MKTIEELIVEIEHVKKLHNFLGSQYHKKPYDRVVDIPDGSVESCLIENHRKLFVLLCEKEVLDPTPVMW